MTKFIDVYTKLRTKKQYLSEAPPAFFTGTIRISLDGNTVFLLDKLQIFYCIIILCLAVAVIIEFDF